MLLRTVRLDVSKKGRNGAMKPIWKSVAVWMLTACMGLGMAGCASKEPGKTDAVTTPSVYTNLYTNLDQAGVLEAMSQYQGLCNVATVNADGTPNLAIFVPGVDDSHIMFGWADNASKSNVERTKQAVITYDVVNPSAETKEGRHCGAVLKVVLEEDPAVLDEIYAANEALRDAFVILKIVEVLPVG